MSNCTYKQKLRPSQKLYDNEAEEVEEEEEEDEEEGEDEQEEEEYKRGEEI